jgi:CRISPR system Cascade subunit CasA
MNPTFNLLDEAWIPCVQAEGHPAELGLRDTLTQAHALRELVGESPLVTAALYRLLLAVVHRVFGPAGYDAWYEVWEAGHFDASKVMDYLDTWRHRFDLFDKERPFYQIDDGRVKDKPIVSLVQEIASGNNATLFDHHTDIDGMSLSPGQAARALIAAQTFALGGGKSGIPQNFTDAPWARGVVFLVKGDTLFETLMLNLSRYPDDELTVDPSGDCPSWEMDDPLQPPRSIPQGHLDYLTWYARRVLLIPESMHKGVIVRRMKFTQGLALHGDVLDSMKQYIASKDKQRFGPLPFREERALWRDSAALFKLSQEGYRPPTAFYWLSELIDEDYLDISQTRCYLALGMATKPGQAKVDFYRSESCPLPLRYLTDESLVERLDQALKMAEDVRSQLWGAARTLAALTLSPQSDTEAGRKPAPEDVSRLTDQWAVERGYWSGLEIPFRRMMEDLPEDVEGVLTNWQERLRHTAWAALERIASDLERDTRNLKATVRAREQLAAGLGKVLPRNQGGGR